MKAISLARLTAMALLALSACHEHQGVGGATDDASAATQASNAQMAQDLNLADRADFANAQRGLIAKPTGKITLADGTVLQDFDNYNFLAGPAPETVNPSLWRHAQLNANLGLFKVIDGVYQLRGLDIGNMTLIEGKTGWIVVDTTTARESAEAALAFARKHLGNKPVSAIIITHAHADHFGGILGVVSAQDQASRPIPIIAPAHFMEEATSENVLVGIAMIRRAAYQFGRNLPHDAKGIVDNGIGKDVTWGSVGILPPTVEITQADQPMQVDGVDFVFHNVPGAECPAELSFSIPSMHLYDGAENIVQTMHNLLPIRGAKVRDALRWSNYMDQALEQAKDADVYIGSHTWPMWGNANIKRFITMHRDAYKYLHDQTVRLINQGYTASEIEDMVKLPASIAQDFSVRGYYGDVRYNVRAIYQFYIGMYDGNPANLNPLPPKEIAQRYMDAIGGSAKAMAVAQQAYDKGDYRWAAELLKQVVYAEPDNKEGKTLLAKTFEQMGYASESATWRNAYLQGATELRAGISTQGASVAALRLDMLQQTPIERFLEAMSASINGPKADGVNLKINLVLTDSHESFVLWTENAVLHFHREEAPAADANATLALTKHMFVNLVAGIAGAKDLATSDEVKITGSRLDLIRFFTLLDKAPGNFPIVTR